MRLGRRNNSGMIRLTSWYGVSWLWLIRLEEQSFGLVVSRYLVGSGVGMPPIMTMGIVLALAAGKPLVYQRTTREGGREGKREGEREKE